MIGLGKGSDPLLVVNDCKLAYKLLVENAACIDKHDTVTQLLSVLTGNTFVFQKNGKTQRHRKKHLMTAFHKEGMRRMFKLTKEVTKQKIEEL